MGGSGQWIKSLMSLKKPDKDDQVFGASGKGRKWKLWRTSSGSRAGGYQSASEASETSSVVGPPDTFNAALAAVARAPARDFKILRQEWAAIRIQTAFRAFLARRALRALKAIVRIQALVRGRQVRKQAAITLKCMHALVRVQARVRARRAQLSTEGLVANDADTNRREDIDPLKEAEERWCGSNGTLADVKTKLQMKQEGAIKRGRALSYALSQLQKRSMQSTRPPSPSTFSCRTHDMEKSSCDLTWLDRWMAAKPWDDQETGNHSPDSSRYSKTPDDTHPRRNSHHSDAGSIKANKNNVTTRVSARPPLVPINGRNEVQSASSSEMLYAGSSKSSPVTPASKNMERGDAGKPSYMNATKAVKARQEAVNAERRSGARRQASGDVQYFKKVAFTSVDSDISAASNNSYKGRSSMRRSFDKENYLYCIEKF